MAQDNIEVLKVLFPKKALINGKSLECKKRFWNIFEEDFFWLPLDRNIAVLTKILTSDRSVRSVRISRV